MLLFLNESPGIVSLSLAVKVDEQTVDYTNRRFSNGLLLKDYVHTDFKTLFSLSLFTALVSTQTILLYVCGQNVLMHDHPSTCSNHAVTHTHTHTHTHKCTHTHIYTHTSTHIHLHTHTPLRDHTGSTSYFWLVTNNIFTECVLLLRFLFKNFHKGNLPNLVGDEKLQLPGTSNNLCIIMCTWI